MLVSNSRHVVHNLKRVRVSARTRVFLIMIDHERPLRGNMIDLVNRSMYLFQELLENYIVFVLSINRRRGERVTVSSFAFSFLLFLLSLSLSLFLYRSEGERERE